MRLLLMILSATCLECGANDTHARKVIAEYQAAFERKDVVACARLSAPEMQRNIDEHAFQEVDVSEAIDGILKNTVRVVHLQNAVAYIGWVSEGRIALRLHILLVGEGTALRQLGRSGYLSLLHAEPGWRLSVNPTPKWELAVAATPKGRAAVEAAIKQLDERYFTKWLIEGDDNAHNAIKNAIPSTNR